MWGAVPISEGSCFGLESVWISIAAWDVLSDVWILAMSVPMVWKLKMRFREKVMLTGVFFLGAVSVSQPSLMLVELIQIQGHRFQHHELFGSGEQLASGEHSVKSM